MALGSNKKIKDINGIMNFICQQEESKSKLRKIHLNNLRLNESHTGIIVEAVGINKIMTEISPLPIFYEATQEHQDFYKNNNGQGYCTYVIEPKLAKLRQLHADKLK